MPSANSRSVCLVAATITQPSAKCQLKRSVKTCSKLAELVCGGNYFTAKFQVPTEEVVRTCSKLAELVCDGTYFTAKFQVPTVEVCKSFKLGSL